MMEDCRELNKITLPIYTAISNIASLMDTLSKETEIYRVLDLANAFFSILIAEESQDQFTFTWECRRWTFQVLPQEYMALPTFCHSLVVHDLADGNKPSNNKMYHYTDDLLLISGFREALEEAVTSLTAHSQDRGWAINP